MQLWKLAALLTLQCWIPLVTCGDSQYMDISSFGNAGTVIFKGSKLRVFDIDGVQVAEPRIAFAQSCVSVRYNHLYLKYQLSVPMHIDVNTLRKPLDSSKTVGHVTITGLKARADKALASKEAKVMVMTQVMDSGKAQLLFLCDTFIRCQRLRDEVASNPQLLSRAVRLVAVGRVGANSVSFTVRSAGSPKFDCNLGHWVVFQRRVDGSLSFAQNWDAYVKGFGNPKHNYWMGLDQLFAMTVTAKKNGYADTSRCRLRIETTDLNDKSYWGEYKLFEVLGPQQNYRLRVGQEVAGSELVNFVANHHEMQFSTYDRDHDTHGPDSCSRLFGFGGWWYTTCHSVNLNGAYTTDKSITNNPTYNTVYVGGRYVPMKRTLMKFKCN